MEEIEGTGGLQAAGVRHPEVRLPLSAFGSTLARIPGLWFYGAFAAVSLVLAFFAFAARSGWARHNTQLHQTVRFSLLGMPQRTKPWETG